MLISPLCTATWKHKTHPPQPFRLLLRLGQNRAFLDRFLLRPYSAKKWFFWFSDKNPPPIKVKNLPPIQKSRLQLVHSSLNPIKKIWMEKLVAFLRKTFLKMPIRNSTCSHVGWRFSPTLQKSLVFRTPTRFLIQIFFIGPEKHYSLWKYMMFHHCCSLLLTTAHFSSFSAFPEVRKKRGKFLKMSSSEQQWWAMMRNQLFS